ncbi:hypothetical protein [Lysobacter sp. F6437]|uniref:hypothetical protein n=1 Tax=Lysobacter sp. F6437 TaxID=3459296 RepID=UPI00403D8BB6
MRSSTTILALFLASFAANAAPDYGHCEIAGLALGADKELVGSVASRIVENQGLIGTPGCTAVWRDAYKTGKRLSAGGNWSELDMVTWQKLQDFENSVLDSIIKGMPAGG